MCLIRVANQKRIGRRGRIRGGTERQARGQRHPWYYLDTALPAILPGLASSSAVHSPGHAAQTSCHVAGNSSQGLAGCGGNKRAVLVLALFVVSSDQRTQLSGKQAKFDGIASTRCPTGGAGRRADRGMDSDRGASHRDSSLSSQCHGVHSLSSLRRMTFLLEGPRTASIGLTLEGWASMELSVASKAPQASPNPRPSGSTLFDRFSALCW